MAEIVELSGELMSQTDDAYLIAFGDAAEDEKWIPKSLVEVEKITNDEVIVFTVPEWFAFQHGLI